MNEIKLTDERIIYLSKKKNNKDIIIKKDEILVV